MKDNSKEPASIVNANSSDLNPNDLVDTTTAAKILNTKPGTLPIWRHYGKGPAFLKIGRSVRYHKKDLMEYLASCRRVSTSQA